MNTQLREALLSELVSTNNYLFTLADNDKRKFHAQKRFNLLRALLAHFDEQDKIIELLGRSNDILRKKMRETECLADAVARIMRVKYGDEAGFEYIESYKSSLNIKR